MLGCSFLHSVEYLHIRTVSHMQKSAQLGNVATTSPTHLHSRHGGQLLLQVFLSHCCQQFLPLEGRNVTDEAVPTQLHTITSAGR